MTTQELLDFFDLIQDKYGTPYFTDDEKLVFLNNAMLEFINSKFPDTESEREQSDVEINWNALQDIWPLVYTISDLTMSSSGIITLSSLNTALQSTSGDASTSVYKILNLEMRKGGNRYPIKVVRHNDKSAFEQNYFKKPSLAQPRYTLENGGLQIRPTDQIGKVAISVVKSPRLLALAPSVVNPELGSSIKNRLVAIGLEFAGVASRDDVLKTMLAMTKQP
jgi:hypothetical protein